MKRYFFFFFIPVVLFAGMDDFEAFEAFDKQDKSEFETLKKEIQKCIKGWDFACAQKDLAKIRSKVTSKKDAQTIAMLKTALSEEKEKKRAYEEARRRANAKKSIRIADCQNSSGGTIMCTLYVNGKYDGNIFYKLEDTDKYNIFILGSKNAANMAGYYSIELNSVWTTRCGDSVFGSSNKIFVYDISKALQMYANCAINGGY